jgi:hypothetical protein
VNGPLNGPRAGYFNGNSAAFAATPAVSIDFPFDCGRPTVDILTDVETTVYHRMRATTSFRNRYPNHASTYAGTDGWLSHSIYANDTPVGATNNSTRAYSRVISRWVSIPNQILGAGYRLEFVAAHTFGMNRLPIKGGKIVATPTIGAAVTKLCDYAKSTQYGDNLPCWGAVFADSDFPSNGTNPVHFEYHAYAWFGDAASTKRIATGTYPSILALTEHVHYTGTPSIIHAVVDSVSGNDGTGVANATYATAYATPFATELAATNKLITVQTDLSFCVVTFKAGSHTVSNTALTGGTRTALKGWFMYRGDPADPDPRTNVQLTQSGANRAWWTNSGTTCSFFGFRDCKLTLPASTGVGSFGTRNVFWLDNVDFVNNVSGGWASQFAAAYATRCSGTGSNGTIFGLSGANVRFELVRNCTSTKQIVANCAVSSYSDIQVFVGSASPNLSPTNVIMVNCKWKNAGVGTTFDLNSLAVSSVTKDVGIIQCEGFSTGTSGNPYMNIDHTTVRYENIVMDHCTFSPAVNPAPGVATYNSQRISCHAIPPTAGNPTQPADVIPQYVDFAVQRTNTGRTAIKVDIFSGANDGNAGDGATTGAILVVGGWEWVRGVNCHDNNSEGVDNADVPAIFDPEYYGVNSVTSVPITYVSRGTNMQISSGGRLIPDERESLPWDINGNLRPLGSSYSGAHIHA